MLAFSSKKWINMYLIDKIISRFRKEDGIFFSKIKELLGFSPKNIDLYVEAFTHPTFYKEYTKECVDYQRLEFLGDSVLGAVVSEYLFKKYPKENEGFLTNMRSKMVCRNRLNQVGAEMKLVELLRYGNKDKNSLGSSIEGNLVEALVGAIYIDRGYKVVKKFILNTIVDENHNTVKEFENKVISYKSIVTEWGQKNKKEVIYKTEKDLEDASKNEYFVSTLIIDGEVFAKARDTSKKKASEKVARRAYYKIVGKKNIEKDKKGRKKQKKELKEEKKAKKKQQEYKYKTEEKDIKKYN